MNPRGALALSYLLLAPAVARAQTRAAPAPSASATLGTAYRRLPRGARVRLNLRDADLGDLVRAIGEVTGRRFIFSANLRAIRVTIYSPTPVSADEAYEAFVTALESNGLAVVPAGSFQRIVEATDVARQPVPVVGAGAR